MANLTEEEDKELKRTDLRNSDIRRDFSVIHSKSMKKNHLFLGPARFVNVSIGISPPTTRVSLTQSMTAITTASYFAKADTLPFGHCDQLLLEKNLQRIMATGTVSAFASMQHPFPLTRCSWQEEQTLFV
jgi:hypothetical protein